MPQLPAGPGRGAGEGQLPNYNTINHNNQITIIYNDSIIQVSKRCPNYPPDLDAGLEKANYAFTAVFVVELLLKMMALGIYSSTPAGEAVRRPTPAGGLY